MSNVSVRTTTAPESSKGLVRICLARLQIELKQFFREREAVIFIFSFPVVMLVIFASAFSSQEQFVSGGGASIGAAQYYVTGMVSTGIMLSSFQNLAIFIAVERDDGTLKRLRGTPMPPLAFFAGKIAQVVVTTIVQLTLLLAVAHLAYGVDLPRNGALWLRFGWLVLLGSGAGTVLGIAFSSVPKIGPVSERSRDAHRDRPAVHLRRLLRVRRPASVDAGHRVAVPPALDGTGHAVRLLAATDGGGRARTLMAHRDGCRGHARLVRRWPRPRRPLVPLDATRRRLADSAFTLSAFQFGNGRDSIDLRLCRPVPPIGSRAYSDALTPTDGGSGAVSGRNSRWLSSESGRTPHDATCCARWG